MTLTPAQLAARSGYVLRGNSVDSAAGPMTKAAPALYPHQWSWDAAFVAIGLARVDVRRACAELDTLFRGQWRTGMVPHIVFRAESGAGYFPGPERWACAELTEDAPEEPATSGLCQPPVHALAVQRIAEIAVRRGGDDAAAATAWVGQMYPKLLAWHRYLAERRDTQQTGLLTIYHGWESGMDNSPRWDDAYSRVQVGDLPTYERGDLRHVDDAGQRPTQREYDRYLWLVEELKRARYDDAAISQTGSFRMADVFMSAIFAAANDVLADIAAELGAGEVDELRTYAARFRDGVRRCVDPELGLALDRDLRTGEPVAVETIAGFAPLVSGGLPVEDQRRMIELLESPRWLGHPRLRWALPPSTGPGSGTFRPRAYWRGPTWPVATWLLWWALDRCGETEAAARLRGAALGQLGEGSLAEYYEPFTGEPLGSLDQSWTAAVALDWLC